MNDINNAKLEAAKAYLDKNNIPYIELANGQLQSDGVNLWSTTGKWYDPRKGVKGNGLISFVKHMQEDNHG